MTCKSSEEEINSAWLGFEKARKNIKNRLFESYMIAFGLTFVN